MQGGRKGGKKRKGDKYGSREGQSLVGTYRGGMAKQFVVWHCTNAFEEGEKCVDGVCGKCKMDHGGNGHRCNICNQEIDDYKMEDNQGMMPRKRSKWAGPGPEHCAICSIKM